jgi:SAM-dependent methyltransferase
MDSIAKKPIDNMDKVLSDLLAKAKKDDEFEISFRQIDNKITLEKYITLLKYLVTTGKKSNLQILKSDYLNVSYNYDYENFNNYRITVSGLENINKKLSAIAHRENHVIFSMLLSEHMSTPESGIELINKIKDKKNMIDFDEMGLRARLASEKTVPKSSLNDLLKLSEKERKYIGFRYIQRVSLIIEDTPTYTFRIDLSQVKSAGKPNLIEKNASSPELEFEITIKSELKESQIKKLVEQILEQISNVQKVLQKSNIVMSKQSNIQVIDGLKKLLFGDQEVLIKDLPGMQTQAAEIPHIVDLIPNRYTVTDKADGERTFLYISQGAIYLISNTLEVKQLDLKDMGLTKAKVEEYDSTVLDGEYIFVGSKQKFVFLGFDCLVFKGEDLRKEPKLETRLASLKICTSNLFGQIADTVQYAGPFDIEKINVYYEKGIKKFIDELNKKLDSPKSGSNIIMAKFFIFPLGAHPSEVFAGASLIWNLYTKNPDLKCPYILDGIIFTPCDQIYTRNLKETKNRIYKWKPSSKNSIDFYVEYERDKITNTILNVYDDAESNEELADKSNKELEQEIVHQDVTKFKVKGSVYRILNLHVGKIDGGKEYPVLFQKEKDNYIANLFLSNGEARDIEGNIIQDKTVVEFSYHNDPTIPSGFRWIPLRTRFDKTDSVNMFKRKYGNNSEIAEKTWRSIMDGIEASDIELLGSVESYEAHNKKLKGKITSDVITAERRENIYYQVVTNLAKPMREFHNWIKSNLIYTYCSKKSVGTGTNDFRQMEVLEYSCGKGGDIAKFYHSRVGSYVGFDIDPNGIYSGSDGALSRYQDFKKKFPNWPKMNFLVADGGALLTLEDQTRALGTMNDQNKKMLLDIFDRSDYKTYDIITCQFAVHYFFKSETTLANFVANVSKFLKPSGYLLLTTFDADTVNSSFDESGHITSYYTTQEGEKKVIFDVVKKYSPDLEDLNAPGIPIDVHIPSFEDGFYMTEYLVSKKLMVDTFEANGFRLEDTDLFVNIFNKHKYFFDNSAKFEENHQNKSWYMKVKEYYNHDDPINKSCFTYTKLNRFYVFQKLDDGSTQLEGPKYKFDKTKSSVKSKSKTNKI